MGTTLSWPSRSLAGPLSISCSFPFSLESYLFFPTFEGKQPVVGAKCTLLLMPFKTQFWCQYVRNIKLYCLSVRNISSFPLAWFTGQHLYSVWHVAKRLFSHLFREWPIPNPPIFCAWAVVNARLKFESVLPIPTPFALLAEFCNLKDYKPSCLRFESNPLSQFTCTYWLNLEAISVPT